MTEETPAEVPSTKSGAKPAPSKPKSRKKQHPEKTKAGSKPARVVIAAEQLPRKALEQALRIPRALREVFAGGPAAWPDIAKAASLSLSQQNKYYLWAAQAYGLIEKTDETFSISEIGRRILAPTRPNEDREAVVKAVLTPILFSRFFTDYNGSPFPADEHIANVLEVRYGIPRERTEEANALLKENGLYAGILAQQADGTMVVRLDSSAPTPRLPPPTPATGGSPVDDVDKTETANSKDNSDFASMCFIITPIGDDASQERKHANLVLKSVIEPVVSEFGLVATRADQIDRSGIITQQIFECLARARVCIADLSFNNPNAFYELGVRHMCKQPTIQMIRKGDKIPFDVSQGRTIRIDMTDVYSIVDSIESAKRELREHVRSAMSPEYKGEDNPVNVYLPGVEIRIPQNAPSARASAPQK